MTAVTLFEDGSHITDVTVQYKGEIAVGSGGVGGEHYLRIPAEERPELLAALLNACRNVPNESMPHFAKTASDETMMELFGELFSNTNQDPYVDIRRFLTANNVVFKGEYWPSR